MGTIFWIAVIVFVIWWLFRDRPSDSNHKPLVSSPQPELEEATSFEELRRPVTKRIWREETWKCGPEDVFHKEYVSFTRIKTFQICPRMFELVYLYGFEDKSGRPAQVGSLLHKIVELYTAHHIGHLSDRLKENGAVEDMLNFYDQAVFCTDLTYSIPKSELRPYLSNFVVLNRTASCQILATEHECDSKIGGYALKCIIDRIDEGHQTTLRLIDYKTGKPQNAVNHQLNVYAYALSPDNWSPFQLQYQFLKTGKVRDWSYTAELHRRTEQWLLEGIEEIETSKTFPRNTCRLCDYCGVYQYCDRVP